MKKTFVQSFTAIGGILMAIGASACCIIPFTLFSIGVGGAWVGNLTAMSGGIPFYFHFRWPVLSGGWLLAGL